MNKSRGISISISFILWFRLTAAGFSSRDNRELQKQQSGLNWSSREPTCIVYISLNILLIIQAEEKIQKRKQDLKESGKGNGYLLSFFKMCYKQNRKF